MIVLVVVVAPVFVVVLRLDLFACCPSKQHGLFDRLGGGSCRGVKVEQWCHYLQAWETVCGA